MYVLGLDMQIVTIFILQLNTSKRFPPKLDQGLLGSGTMLTTTTK